MTTSYSEFYFFTSLLFHSPSLFDIIKTKKFGIEIIIRSITMKIGVRKPSLSKSLKARTTSKLKRQVKRAIIPTYGQKGTGLIKDPKRTIYNKVYNKTTVDAFSSVKKGNINHQRTNRDLYTYRGAKVYPASSWYFPVGLSAFCSLLYFTINPVIACIFLIITLILFVKKIKNNPFKTQKDIKEMLEKITELEQ